MVDDDNCDDDFNNDFDGVGGGGAVVSFAGELWRAVIVRFGVVW